jgi:hypothetical protein
MRPAHLIGSLLAVLLAADSLGAPAQTPPAAAPPAATEPQQPSPTQAKPAEVKPAEPKPEQGLPKNLEAMAPGVAVPILGRKVRDASGKDMGPIVDVLVDRDGRVRAAVVDFGGFLGVGACCSSTPPIATRPWNWPSIGPKSRPPRNTSRPPRPS